MAPNKITVQKITLPALFRTNFEQLLYLGLECDELMSISNVKTRYRCLLEVGQHSMEFEHGN